MGELFKDKYEIGDNGPEVIEIQEALGMIYADGAFGPLTRKAVIEFQKMMGLVADGIVGPKTMGLIFPSTDNS